MQANQNNSNNEVPKVLFEGSQYQVKSAFSQSPQSLTENI